MIKSIIRKTSYNAILFPGVLYNEKNIVYHKYIKKGTKQYLMNDDHINRIKGVIGCWIAHSQVLETVVEHSGITVVLEDDFICQEDFFENALNMINNFNQDFDVILFDTWGIGPLEIHKVMNNIYFPRNCDYPYYGGAHCLFINNSQISKILDIKNNSQVMDYDGFLLSNEEIKAYVFYTGQCTVINVGSDISNNFGSKIEILINTFLCVLPETKWLKKIIYKRFFKKNR